MDTSPSYTGKVADKSYRGELLINRMLHVSDIFVSPLGGTYQVIYTLDGAGFLAEVITHKRMKPGDRLVLDWVTGSGFEIAGNAYEGEEA